MNLPITSVAKTPVLLSLRRQGEGHHIKNIQMMISLPDNHPTVKRDSVKDKTGMNCWTPFWYVVKLTSTRSAQLCLNKLVSCYPISASGAARNYFWTNYFSILAFNVSESGKTGYRCSLQVSGYLFEKLYFNEQINKCSNSL